MVRLRPYLVALIFLSVSCTKNDPAPQFEPCVEGAHYNDDGAVYFVTCPDLNPTKCIHFIKIIIDVEGFHNGPDGKLVIRRITSTTVEITERVVSLEGQKFQIELSYDKSEPTTYRVTFVLPKSDCTVNNATDYYTYVVDAPCGSRVDLKFDIHCEE